MRKEDEDLDQDDDGEDGGGRVSEELDDVHGDSRFERERREGAESEGAKSNV